MMSRVNEDYRIEEEIFEFRNAVVQTAYGTVLAPIGFAIAAFGLVDAVALSVAPASDPSNWMGTGVAFGMGSAMLVTGWILMDKSRKRMGKSWRRLMAFAPQEEANTSFSREN